VARTAVASTPHRSGSRRTPTFRIVLADEAVERPFLDAGVYCMRPEKTRRGLGVLERLANDGRRVV